MTRSSRLFLAAFLSAGLCLQAGDKLSRAAVDGDFARAKQCVASGEKVTDLDKWGWTALHWATYYGNTDIALWLIDSGADVNAKTLKGYGRYEPGITPLILAAYYGHAEVLQALLKKGADPAVKDATGHVALDYARQFNFQDCVRLLEGK